MAMVLPALLNLSRFTEVYQMAVMRISDQRMSKREIRRNLTTTNQTYQARCLREVEKRPGIGKDVPLIWAYPATRRACERWRRA
jgi:hypothetical protein